MSRRKNLKALLAGGSCALALATAGMAAAETRDYDVPPGDLMAALDAYARQSGLQIIYKIADVTGVKSGGAQGALSDDEALNQLLEGTNFEIRRDPSGAVAIALEGRRGPQFASAAAEDAEGTVEALIVTAQKREEDIQDVPIAISAFTQDDLTRSQVAGGPDLITQVPNMTFTKTNFSSYSVQLRGIGTQAISATTDPAVAVAFNNTPFIRNRFFEQEFYDLQRVEVLRGPQGTLYGRNATAGVVNIISQKPRFTAEAKVSGDASNFNSSRLEGMVNIPLVEDKVAVRIAGAWTKREGYATNELSGEQIDGRDLWSTRVSLRVAPTDAIDINLIWEHFEEDDDRLRSGKQLCKKDVVTNVGGVEITNYFDTSTAGGQTLLFAGVQGALSQGCKRNSLYAMDSFQRPNGIMLPYYLPLGAVGLPAALTDPYVSVVNSSDPHVISETNDQPEDLRVIQSTIDPDYRAKADIGELQVSIDLSDTLTLSSETAYGRDLVYSFQDFNRFNTAPGAWGGTSSALPEWIARGVLRTDLGPHYTFCDPQLGCSDRLMAVDISTAKATQFSQEFRLASDFDGPFNFSLGANWLRADSEDKYYVFFNSISLIAAAGPPFNTYGDYIVGETDNVDFMINGYLQGDPNGVFPVQASVYMDPNPINNLNDEGHNYFLSKNPYKLISYAVFGEAYYKLSETLKVTAGLRWTVDKKEAPRVPTWVLASRSVGYPVAEVIEQEWREPTGRLTVDWKPELAFTDETMVYASYAHGYKAGGSNPPGYVREFYAEPGTAELNAEESLTRPKTFDPEFVDAFEVGSKNTFGDGRVVLNLAAFYYDYKGYQVSEIVDRSAFNRNFDATVWGVEFEADWRPLENLKFGFKGGYEKTRIADGEEAIDLMDRTAGDPDWILVRPFPTFASSCILPTFVVVNPNGTIGAVGGVGGGGPSGCEIAYLQNYDPVTHGPYVDLTQPGAVPGVSEFPGIQFNNLSSHPGYPGWDPTLDYGNNNGEGIAKPLGGNELPNAPQWTATITADYSVPLPGDWLATLHTDLHWQAESWWRVFNDHEYSRLDEYFTMNLAAIFTNEEAGWNVMAYVKNVTDETAITGAFLNSDDTGLTTNVFLTEPRLYGLRVTKNWTGDLPWASLGGRRQGPFPLTVELGGQVQRQDPPTESLKPDFIDAFPSPLDVFEAPQQDDLDWGDGRDVKLTYRPGNGPWKVTGGVRIGKTNGSPWLHAEWSTDPVCAVSGYYAALCDMPKYSILNDISMTNHADGRITDREEHTLIDFMVGRDLGFGGLRRSSVSVGLRHAAFESTTDAVFRGMPDWELEEGFFFGPATPHTRYDGAFQAQREFSGVGPTASWEASYPLLGGDELGRLDIDWSVTGGVLFGDQETAITGSEKVSSFETGPIAIIGLADPDGPIDVDVTPHEPISRSESSTVPTASVSLGLSYEIDRFMVGAGYRWERYFDAIDGGFEEHRSYDRTIDGPYFKLSVGFGG